VIDKIVGGQQQAKQLHRSESPKPRRRPKKVAPLKRKMSFTTCQLKYAEDLQLEDPLKNVKKPTLTDLVTIKKMQAAERWPIPEQLINRPDRGGYQLVIDSIMHAAYDEKEMKEWANYRQEL
jgi:hypothetical protein